MPDWFHSTKDQKVTCDLVSEFMKKADQEEMEKNFVRAIDDTIREQTELGLDDITDGEIRRENYIYGFCRSVGGIDFENPEEREVRNGAFREKCPVIRSKLYILDESKFHSDEWILSNEIAKKYNKTLKFTLPGPLTIAETLTNVFYSSEQELCQDLAAILRREILHLKALGCTYI